MSACWEQALEEIASFGEWLKQRRRALHLTRDALAQQLNVAVGTLRKWESDERRPSKELAERLAQALELPAAEQTIFVKVARAGLAVDHLVTVALPAEPPAPRLSPTLPVSTVTLLFADIEGSTRLLQQLGDRYAGLLHGFRELMRTAVQSTGGHEVDTQGDAYFAVFPRASDALMTALAAQRALARHPWPSGVVVQARMALHTGEPEVAGGGYIGMDVHRAARLCAAGHGGQVLLSSATQELLREHLPPGVAIRELGTYHLKDIPEPERIGQVVAADVPTDFPPIRALAAHRHNLPSQATPLVGRRAVIAAVRQRLLDEDTRLLTLTGPGGVGKTRLALQVAAEALDQFPDGVYFVNLAPLRDPALVASTIATALGLKESDRRSADDVITDHLRDKQILLLLDNFEHIMEAATTVADLLAACSRVRVLVTSRITLQLSGEQVYPAPPLSLPDVKRLPAVEALAQFEAVALFVHRARAVQPDFQVTSANASVVAEICVRLDGLPLAIELAAARIPLLPPATLLGRLSRRLTMLTSGRRDLPPRQQTLRNIIDWSYTLLDPWEQALFARLAVFHRGWTLEAAAIATPDDDPSRDALNGVQTLLAHSLAQREADTNGEPRFFMLETIREYALERLVARNEVAILRRRHAAYYRHLAETTAGEWMGFLTPEALETFEREHDNLRAALRWAIEQTDAEFALALAGTLAQFWVTRGHYTEGVTWLRAALALGGPVAPLTRGRALFGLGELVWCQGDWSESNTIIEEYLGCFREAGDKRGIAWATYSLAFGAEDFQRRRALLEESLVLFRDMGDKSGVVDALSELAWLASAEGDFAKQEARFEECVRLSREMVDDHRLAKSLSRLAVVAERHGDYARATGLLDECLALARKLDVPRLTVLALAQYGLTRSAQGDHGGGRAALEESLALGRELGNKDLIAFTLRGLAKVAERQGNYPCAEEWFGESLIIYRELEHVRNIADVLRGVGRVALQQGDDARSTALFRESLRLCQAAGELDGIAFSLEALAADAARMGRGNTADADSLVRAACLWGAAEALRERLGARLPRYDTGEYERIVCAARESVPEGTWNHAWAAGRAMSLEQAIAYALEGEPAQPSG